jgi:hypothetical protein
LVEGLLNVIFGYEQAFDYNEELVAHISLINDVAACFKLGLFE